MKKTLFLSLAFAAGASVSYGQFYLRGGLGYAMPQASNTMNGGGIINGSYNNTSGSFDLKGASFSTGLWGDLGLGYLINEHIGIQLDASLGLANKKYTAVLPEYTMGGVPGTLTFTQQANVPVIISPSIILKTGGNPWDIYCRFGPALPLHTEMTQHQLFVNDANTGAITTYDITSRINNYFSLGISACAGVEYKLDDNIAIWGEASVLSLSPYIQQSTVTAFAVNGQSYSTRSVSPSQINYKKSGVTDTARGTVQNSYSQPFSNICFMVGIRFNLSSPHHKKSSNHTDEGYDRNKPYKRR